VFLLDAIARVAAWEPAGDVTPHGSAIVAGYATMVVAEPLHHYTTRVSIAG
jgi:hypothetical protein